MNFGHKKSFPIIKQNGISFRWQQLNYQQQSQA